MRDEASFPGQEYEPDIIDCHKNNQSGKCAGHTLTSDLIHTATVAFNALSDEEQKIVLDVQRHSWLRGEKTLDSKPAAREYDPQDINYYLARVEGQIARIEAMVSADSYETDVMTGTIRAAKAFLASLRNALDPHRIDVA